MNFIFLKLKEKLAPIFLQTSHLFSKLGVPVEGMQYIWNASYIIGKAFVTDKGVWLRYKFYSEWPIRFNTASLVI